MTYWLAQTYLKIFDRKSTVKGECGNGTLQATLAGDLKQPTPKTTFIGTWHTYTTDPSRPCQFGVVQIFAHPNSFAKHKETTASSTHLTMFSWRQCDHAHDRTISRMCEKLPSFRCRLFLWLSFLAAELSSGGSSDGRTCVLHFGALFIPLLWWVGCTSFPSAICCCPKALLQYALKPAV